MAAVKGDVGKIMFHNAAGTEADIGGLRSWELNITKDTQETTVMGNTSKTFIGGLISGEGSATLLYNPSGNSDYQAFIDDVLVTGDAGDALFELFPDSAQSAKKIGFSVGGFEDALLSGMFEKYDLKLSDVELININFSLSPSLISKKVDAVIGAFRNFELNQMDIVKRPGKAFYPEEHGVPHYEELIYIINKKDRNKKKFKKFLNAVQKATINIVNNPDKTWLDFSNYKNGLNDELNKRAYKDTVRRFALRPNAYDLESYTIFQEFLLKKNIIKKKQNIELFIKP